ncbi:hypothetical protein ACIPSJ_29745 [Streptomyces sp. NPDC090088]|uniref:hypothetical protein n=1 Tax=Streptomyces sp. NPDC090088 TaxID=3365944 RepID=UPI00381DCFEA
MEACVRDTAPVLVLNGVHASDDGLAAGGIAALKADKATPLPPATGQDAQLAAVRRVVSAWTGWPPGG